VNTVVCFVMGGNGVSELSITFKCMSQKDLVDNKRILQRESLHCILMESASSLISSCTDVGNRFRRLKVTAFKNVCNRLNGVSSTSTSISCSHFHSNISMTANCDYHTANYDYHTANYDYHIANYDYHTANYDYNTANYDYHIANYNYHTANYDYHIANYDYHTANYDHHTANYDHHTANYDYHTANYDYHTANYDYHTANYDYHTPKTRLYFFLLSINDTREIRVEDYCLVEVRIW